jgi:hypothetical protein
MEDMGRLSIANRHESLRSKSVYVDCLSLVLFLRLKHELFQNRIIVRHGTAETSMVGPYVNREDRKKH